MKKETFTEKLIKRTYGISGPLDEYKRREADSIGNQVFIVLFYLMIFGNLIPLLLAYKYPQEVALIYPPLILVIALIASGYVTYQMKKTGITVIEPDMLNEKERKKATTLPRSESRFVLWSMDVLYNSSSQDTHR
ncbi:membrane protein [Streptococcus pneumoniae]|nr:membrane protein [Streptococcus pneumoniae]CAG5759332.1 membrane protein [Streptococcus pneumoniae]CAG5797878.1 membrane protein [Streptococcus pneumoniae]CAG5855388.1 membrane protein [Streptococcus pneumoniae]CAG6115762.1 membrane protein [Streptococcus pneumoniae]